MLNQPHTGFTRIPYAQRCRLSRGETSVEAVLCNVSVLGVYVTLDPLPAVGDKLDVSFTLPGGGEPVTAPGTVTWQNPEEPGLAKMLPPGCGIRFDSLRPQDHERIERLVSEYKGTLPLGVGAAQPFTGFVRVPYLRRCQVMAGSRPLVGVVCNVSALGVYVALDEIPFERERVEVSFMLPRESRRFIAVADVVWRNPPDAVLLDRMPPGCGLRFVSLSPGDRARIERLVLEYEYCATVSGGQSPTT
jgi:hypothetical protein